MVRWFLGPTIHQEYDSDGSHSTRPALASLADRKTDILDKRGKLVKTIWVKEEEHIPGCSWSMVHSPDEKSCLIRVEAPDLSFIDIQALIDAGVIYQEIDSKEKVKATAAQSPWTRQKWEGTELEKAFGVVTK